MPKLLKKLGKISFLTALAVGGATCNVAVAATFTVNQAIDGLPNGGTLGKVDGDPLTLSEAIFLANESAGADTIVFDNAVFNGTALDLTGNTAGALVPIEGDFNHRW